MEESRARGHLGELVFYNLTRLSGFLVFATLVAIFIALVIYSLPAIDKFGVSFIWSTEWNVSQKLFGGYPAIYGSIVSTFIAMLIATPIAIGIAIFLTEIAPFKIRNFFSVNIELLAAIPSIIYGMWGFLFFVPIVRDVFGGTGLGLLTGGLVLSIMILPFIASVTRDSMNTTPAILKESAYALGATKFDVIKDVVIPYAKAGIVGSVIIALGRAFGETMAVAFLLGGLSRVPESVVDPGTSIPVTLATQFGEAMGTPLYESVLFYLALILFVISFGAIAIAKFVFLRKKKGAK